MEKTRTTLPPTNRGPLDLNPIGNEQFAAVRLNLDFATNDTANFCLAVTSATVGEGKSLVSANLARTYAQAGQTVLLIDANLRRPTLHQTFHLSNETGLSAYLSDQSVNVQTVTQTPVTGLTVMTSGPHSAQPAELLASARMRGLLAVASKAYQRVIIDCPALLPVTDGEILAHLATQTVLVVRQNFSLRGNVTRAVKLLDRVHADVVGTIFNDAQSHDQRAYAGYQPPR